MRQFSIFGVLAIAAGSASAQIRITEWAYSAGSGEYVEFTNVGASPIDMTGWSYDDDSRAAGTVSLSGFGTVAPGQSVILAEDTASSFAASWNLSGVSIVGSNTTNLSRNDEINLYDNTNALIDRLTFGDQNIAGSIRTQNIAGIPSSAAAVGANNVLLWQLAAVGDGFGSYTSLFGDVGNPGTYVPEPTSFALLVLGSAFAIRRR